MKRLVPIGGLCNRLRAILSARSAWGHVEVLWAASDAVSHASLTDVFYPLHDVTFIHAGNGHAHDLERSKWGYDCMTSGIVYGAKPGWTTGYSELRPLRPIEEMISKIRHAMGSYLALHARRTDHSTHAPVFGHFTTNEELLEWAHATGAASCPLYLATDDRDTFDWFSDRWRTRRLFWHRVPDRVHGYEVRPGTLADAVVDLFVCAGAAWFRGSWISSFSETIDLLRCGGAPEGGFTAREHMPSADAEWYRGRPDRWAEWNVRKYGT